MIKEEKIAYIKGTIVQIALVWLILPVVMGILKLLGAPAKAFYDWFIGTLGSIEPISLGFSVAEGAITNGIKGAEMMELSVSILFNTFAQSIIMGLMCHIFKRFFEIAGVPGIPIISTLLGVAAGLLVIYIMNQLGNVITELISTLMTIAIISVGIKLMMGTFSTSGIKFFELKDFASLILDSLCAVMACIYVSTWVLSLSLVGISQAKAIGVCFAISVVFVVFLVVMYLLSRLLGIDK